MNDAKLKAKKLFFEYACSHFSSTTTGEI